MTKKHISVNETQQFLSFQSKASYSSVHLLEIHRRLFEISKLTMQMSYSSGYSNTLLFLDKIIDKLKNEVQSGSVSYDNIPLTPAEKSLIDEISVVLASNTQVLANDRQSNQGFEELSFF